MDKRNYMLYSKSVAPLHNHVCEEHHAEAWAYGWAQDLADTDGGEWEVSVLLERVCRHLRDMKPELLSLIAA